MTKSITKAVKETNRRREIQEKYNKENGIVPKTIIKPIKNTLEITKKSDRKSTKMSKSAKELEIEKLQKLMREASDNLDFEQAIYLRDMIKELKD